MSKLLNMLKSNIPMIAKAVAGALVPVVLFALGWLIEKTGAPIDVDPQEVGDWIGVTVTSVLTFVAVWYTKNQAAPES